MNKEKQNIILGNEYDWWYGYGIKKPIITDISPYYGYISQNQ